MTKSRRTAARSIAAAGAAVVVSVGCASPDAGPLDAHHYGAAPDLPSPESRWLPTVRVAKAVGWRDEGAPRAAEGMVVTAFARGLEHPRWLLALPNGDVLVAESAAPPRPSDAGTTGISAIRGWIQKKLFARAGSAVTSADRITLLRDTDGDGVAESRHTLAQGNAAGLRSPIGMQWIDDRLYVANADGIVSFPYRLGQLRIEQKAQPLIELPSGRNHHWTKNIMLSADGRSLYATVGSNSNIAEHGMQEEQGRAAIWKVDRKTGHGTLFASGLRNPNGMAIDGATGTLWTVVNERDELGDNLVPDYLSSVREGGFYGWPWSYYGQHVDQRVQPQDADRVQAAIVPEYSLGSHVAALGLVLDEGESSLPFGRGAYIGRHGSWNRNPPSGYDVVFVAFRNGRPAAVPPRTVLDGFLSADGEAMGRPVGVAIDRRGGLLVADDVGNAVWRVSAKR